MALPLVTDTFESWGGWGKGVHPSHTLTRWVRTHVRWGGMGWGRGALPGSPPRPPVSLLPSGYSTSSVLQMLHPECKELPEPNLLPGQLSHGAVGVKEGRVQWISMAFESVSSRGQPGTVPRARLTCVP